MRYGTEGYYAKTLQIPKYAPAFEIKQSNEMVLNEQTKSDFDTYLQQLAVGGFNISLNDINNITEDEYMGGAAARNEDTVALNSGGIDGRILLPIALPEKKSTYGGDDVNDEVNINASTVDERLCKLFGVVCGGDSVRSLDETLGGGTGTTSFNSGVSVPSLPLPIGAGDVDIIERNNVTERRDDFQSSLDGGYRVPGAFNIEDYIA